MSDVGSGVLSDGADAGSDLSLLLSYIIIKDWFSCDMAELVYKKKNKKNSIV